MKLDSTTFDMIIITLFLSKLRLDLHSLRTSLEGRNMLMFHYNDRSKIKWLYLYDIFNYTILIFLI